VMATTNHSQDQIGGIAPAITVDGVSEGMAGVVE
jgi:hypothetical protein